MNLRQAVADLVFDQLAESLAQGRNEILAEHWEIEVIRLEPLLFRVRATPPEGLPRHFSVRVSEVT